MCLKIDLKIDFLEWLEKLFSALGPRMENEWWGVKNTLKKTFSQFILCFRPLFLPIFVDFGRNGVTSGVRTTNLGWNLIDLNKNHPFWRRKSHFDSKNLRMIGNLRNTDKELWLWKDDSEKDLSNKLQNTENKWFW